MRVTRDFDTECVHEVSLYESALALFDSGAAVEEGFRDALKTVVERFERRFNVLARVGIAAEDYKPATPFFHPIYGQPLEQPFNYHGDDGVVREWRTGTPFDLDEYDRGRGVVRKKGKSILIRKMDPRIGVLRTFLNGRRRLLHTNSGKPVLAAPSAIVYLKDQLLNGDRVLLDKSDILGPGIIGAELWIDGISMADDLVAGGLADCC